MISRQYFATVPVFELIISSGYTREMPFWEHLKGLKGHDFIRLEGEALNKIWQ